MDRRVSRHCKVHFRQVRISEYTIVRKNSQGQGAGQSVAGGWISKLQSLRIVNRVPTGVRSNVWQARWRDSCQAAARETGEDSGHLRSTFVEEQVLGRRFLQLGWSLSHSLHFLPRQRGQEGGRNHLPQACERLVGRHLFPRVVEDGHCNDEREGLNTVAVAMTNAKAYEQGWAFWLNCELVKLEVHCFYVCN